MRTEHYLGDGLYFSFDGFAVWLRAPRERGDHEVALDPQVLAEFIRRAMALPLCAKVIRRNVLAAGIADGE